MSQISINENILDLPSDIHDLVLSNLDRSTIVNLSLTCHRFYQIISNSSTIQAHIFQLSYNDSLKSYTWNKQHPDWSQINKDRKNASLYSWGSLTGGRLGYTVSYLHESNQDANFVRSGFNNGVFKPTKIPKFEKSVKLIKAGGFSFQILTSEGDIYSTGSSWHYGHNSGVSVSHGRDYNQLIALAREQEQRQRQQQQHPIIRRGRGGPSILPIGGIGGVRTMPYTLPNAIEDTNNGENKEVRKVKVVGDETVKFKDINSGRAHFVGLSEDHVVYSFDDHDIGIPLNFKGIQNKVKKTKAGWDYNLVEFYGRGLAYWRKREPLLEDSVSSDVEAIMITDREVVDFIGLENYIIYIDSKLTVWKFNIAEGFSVELPQFPEQLKKLNKTLLEPKAIKISGFFQTFVIYSNIDVCLFGQSNKPDEVTTIPELNSTGCLDIQIGDYHLLALLASGKLLSWGLESKNCGCLGLGTATETLERGGIREGESSVRVTIPTTIETLENCVGIACGGWQSCAIVNEKPL